MHPMLMQAQLPLSVLPASGIRRLDQAQPSSRESPGAAGRSCLPRATAQPETATKEGWDPEGLLQRPPGKGLLADHAARRRAKQAQLPTAESLTHQQRDAADSKDVPLSLSRTQPANASTSQPPAAPATGRTLSADPTLLAELNSVLEQQFWPVDLSRQPAAELLHLDPPIMRLPHFVAPETCESIMQLAAAGGEAPCMQPAGPAPLSQAQTSPLSAGLMQPSRVGGDNVSGPASQQNVRR